MLIDIDITENKIMKSRKVLVPIDINNPKKKIEGFLYPYTVNNKIQSFKEINTGKEWTHGMVVLKGGGIDKNDLFKEIVDTGIKISSVEVLLKILDNYLLQVKEYRIGHIVSIKPNGDSFSLFKVEKK